MRVQSDGVISTPWTIGHRVDLLLGFVVMNAANVVLDVHALYIFELPLAIS